VGAENGLAVMEFEDAGSGRDAICALLEPEQSGDCEPSAIGLQRRFPLEAPLDDLTFIRGYGEQKSDDTQHLSAIIVDIMPSTLIRNGTVVTAERATAGDILVEGETIRDIAPSLPAQNADRVIDATGMLVLPGGIDAHTH